MKSIIALITLFAIVIFAAGCTAQIDEGTYIATEQAQAASSMMGDYYIPMSEAEIARLETEMEAKIESGEMTLEELEQYQTRIAEHRDMIENWDRLDEFFENLKKYFEEFGVETSE